MRIAQLVMAFGLVASVYWAFFAPNGFGKDGANLLIGASVFWMYVATPLFWCTVCKVIRTAALRTVSVRAAASEQMKPPPVSSYSSDDFIGKLERLATLREQGVLSEAEFRFQKAKII